MDSIELFYGIRQEFCDLKYKDNDQLDRLKRRLKMLVTNILGKSSSYYSDIVTITYSPTFSYSGMPESIRVDAWDSGKNRTINLIDTIVEELEYFPKDDETKSFNQQTKIVDSSKVFIVHGHDNEAKTEVARFVERLDLEAIILHEQINSGATIIEKLEKYTDVGFAIVLYTPDDIGTVKNKSDNLNLRARQNVVFEHGLLIGKIGRNNVVALVKDTVEIPNDISGVVYETMDSKGAWKFQIAKELKASGYTIDMNAI